MSQDVSTINTNDLLAHLRDNFASVDNVPENVEKRDTICMEARASLLIEANCTGERFPAFMKCGKYTNSGWVYSFRRQFSKTSVTGDDCSSVKLNWLFDEWILRNDRVSVKNTGDIADRWQLGISDIVFINPLNWIQLQQKNDEIEAEYLKHLDQDSKGIRRSFNSLQEGFSQVQAQFNYEYRSRFELCKDISPYKTPEQVCRFFGNHPDVFSKLKLSGMWPDRFFESKTLDIGMGIEPDCTEEQQVQSYFERLTPCSVVSKKRSTLPRKYYEKWFCQAFPFRDQYGEIRMQLIKLYDEETQSKLLIPVTTWMRGNFPYNQFFCVPVPEDRQPLYNLDLLLDPETQIIILTDSVELADSNQRHAPPGVVFTSFICAPGRYDQVDWEPLKGKEVHYLIANHSDIILETATLKARELQNYFIEEEVEIALSFLVVSINYSPNSKKKPRDFKTVDDILAQYRENQPQVNQDSIRLLGSGTEFDEFCKKAEAFINAKPLEFWQGASSSQEQQRLIEKESNKRKDTDYLLRPFLLRNQVSMLYASKSTGKSALALSMAAVVVGANKPLLYEKWWTVPEPKNKPLNKVLYLDFENGEDVITRRKTTFAHPYWPKEKADRERCDANFIIKDMSSVQGGVDYSKPDNWQTIIDLLEEAKHQGIQGQPVDLLVIDTLTKFTRKPYTSDLNISDFINKLRSHNVAILLVHHEGSKGEVHGWRCGLDDLYVNLRLYREKDTSEKGISPIGNPLPTLEDPLILEFQSSRSDIESIPAFEIKFDGEWVEHYRDNDPNKVKSSEERRREEFKRIVKHYESKGVQNQDIFPILGISKDTYYKLKK